MIRGLADQHTTMIIVTHEMSFARDVADQVIFMDGGVVVEEGRRRPSSAIPSRSAPASFWRNTGGLNPYKKRLWPNHRRFLFSRRKN